MSLLDTFAQFYLIFFLQNLIHGLGIRKERIHVSEKGLRAELCPFESLNRKKMLFLLLLDWSMDFPEIKYIYVNTNLYEVGH